MGKKTDIDKVEQILKNGFALPDEVEMFFDTAKKRAVETMLKARAEVKRKLAEFDASAEKTWNALPADEKVEITINWRGERVERPLGYRRWYLNKYCAIERDYPFRGYGDKEAISKTEEACDYRRICFIIKVNAITGDEVTAATLHIDPASGDVNGTIAGKSGTASVRTIGAGGYNIQCYHFRCLVREVKHRAA
jgi:hypothetical protein